TLPFPLTWVWIGILLLLAGFGCIIRDPAGLVCVVVLAVFELTPVLLVSFWRYGMVCCLLGNLASGVLSVRQIVGKRTIYSIRIACMFVIMRTWF
ncbi:hypothetical protein PIB30_101207, partial [Stylosanthes scabra]|nr:hypothetical protein [Stylosanthes scabra]